MCEMYSFSQINKIFLLKVKQAFFNTLMAKSNTKITIQICERGQAFIDLLGDEVPGEGSILSEYCNR